LIDTWRKGERARKNRVVRIQSFSFINPNKKDHEIITAENSKYIIFCSIIVDNMIN
jgi:hypothetical protein